MLTKIVPQVAQERIQQRTVETNSRCPLISSRERTSKWTKSFTERVTKDRIVDVPVAVQTSHTTNTVPLIES